MDEYIWAYLPGIFLFVWNDVTRKFLNSLGKTKIPMICLCISTAFQYAACYLLTFHYDLGVKGLGQACFFTNLVLFLLYSVFSLADA